MHPKNERVFAVWTQDAQRLAPITAQSYRQLTARLRRFPDAWRAECEVSGGTISVSRRIKPERVWRMRDGKTTTWVRQGRWAIRSHGINLDRNGFFCSDSEMTRSAQMLSRAVDRAIKNNVTAQAIFRLSSVLAYGV